MKLNQNARLSMLRKIGSLLLTGSMLISSFAVLSSCKDSSTDSPPADTTTAIDPSSEDYVAPIEHFVAYDDGIYSLISPNGNLQINLYTAGSMIYGVTGLNDKGETVEWVRPSSMGVQLDNANYYLSGYTVIDATFNHINRSFPLMGNQSTVKDHCFEAVLTLQRPDGYTYYLDARAYNNGVAFRYRMPAEEGVSSRILTAEYTTYNLRTDVTQSWYGEDNQDYEPVIEMHSPADKSGHIICAPLTAVVGNRRGYISIMEGALTDSYSGVNLIAKGDYSYGTTLYTRQTTGTRGDMISGWRLINVADDLNGLVNNYNIYSVNEPADEALYADTSWIEPGRSAWSWNVDYQGPKYEQMLEYTRMAAELGYEYNIIDEGWYSWSDYENKLADIGALGDELGVKQILWLGVTRGTDRADAVPNEARVDAIFELMERTHLDGIKMDFWWSEVNTYSTELQKYTLTSAAEHKFVVNYHGCNKNTGLNVTFPNEVTREAVRGQENVGNSNNTNYETQASWLNAQLYTRFLAGHADWTPASHTAMQIASIICIDSPFMTISSDPKLVLQSPAVEFIKSIPSVWDKTVVLSDSVLGSYSVYAKQKDGVWFVGGISSLNVSKAKVDLSEFITDGGTYTAEIWTGGKDNLTSKTITVTKNDIIEIGALQSSEGFAIRLSKLNLSQYGGKINGAITVTASDGATVKYTTDGSDPRTSDTAVEAKGSITLNESCRLKVAITDGDGKGTMMSYRFNKMD